MKAYGGRSWSTKKDARIPAKQTVKETCELLAAYCVHSGRAWVRFFKEKTTQEVIKFLVWLKRRLKHYRPYVILDCFSTHRSRALKRWVKGKSITLVELPTNCSWLNPVERLLALIDKDVLANSNYVSAKELKAAIRKYIRKTFPKKI